MVRISAETEEYTEYYVVDRASNLSQILQIERVYKDKDSNAPDDSSNKVTNYYYGLGLIYEDSDEGLRVYHNDHQGSVRKITDILDYKKKENREKQWEFRRALHIDEIAHRMMEEEKEEQRRNADPELNILQGHFEHGGIRIFQTFLKDGKNVRRS